MPSDSPLPSDSPGSPPADDADTAVVGPLVPIVVWRAARHDPPVGLGSGIGPTPRLAALLTGLYTDPGVTVVDLTGDARLTAAAGGRRYLAVDDEAGLRRATHLAGTVGLIVFSWPPAPGPPPPGAGPLVRRRPTLPAGSIRHPPAGPATQPHAAAPAATDRPARPGPRRGFCSADRPAAVSGSAAGTGVPFGCRSGSAVERRWPGPGRDPADRGAPIRWPGVAGA